MLASLHHIDWIPILVVTLIGFALGAIWYTALFGKAWQVEMKLGAEECEKAKGHMAPSLIKGFILTLISTFGLWLLIDSHGVLGYRRGAAYRAGVGRGVVGGRREKRGVWGGEYGKLLAINVGHEVLLFAIQGAIFGHWR